MNTEMLAFNTTDRLAVYNKPFFVNELLAAIYPEHITHGMFDEMVKDSRVYDLSTILTAMTRQIDISGFTPNLAGVLDNPQEVLELLANLGHLQLLKISTCDPELQKEIFNTLAGTRCTLRALLILDESQREVINQLIQIRQQSKLALVIRKVTEDALRDLYRNPMKLRSYPFDKAICFHDRSPLYQREPRICYPKRVKDGAVVEVWQLFYMPMIGRIRLPETFGKLSVKQVLSAITPDIYRRKNLEDYKFDPRTPFGFMGLLGKVGGALPRLIASQVRKNEQFREKVIQEQELARSLYESYCR
ncbi:MAG: hypothetical protein LUO89_14225 [Methanothrix sp.]|nr:hypothetical protein [Methanothrix sp.]